MAIISIDVDLTILASDQMWFDFLENIGSYKVGQDPSELRYNLGAVGSCNYNLLKHFDLPEDRNGFDFWLQKDLYQQNNNQIGYIYDGCVQTIKKLYDAGHEIVFTSFCQTEHEYSKIEFLKHTFPFIYAEDFHFISTKSKGHVMCDVLIDDRNLHHKQVKMLQPDSLTIKLQTQYTQECRESYTDHKVEHWNEIANILRRLM
jgi:5'(3')-deoxyribonucleotidase